MEAPAKRVLTDTVHDAIIAANTSRHDIDFISDDLTARLQNVGSRVRKSVAEGYSTPVATPLTQSPAKQHYNTPVGLAPTSNFIFQSVFGSPTRLGATPAAAPGILSPSPSPSPRKRTREDHQLRERDADAMDCCEASDADSDDSDDDEVLITPSVAGGGFPHVLANARPIRPLRRPRIAQPVFATGATVAAAATVVVQVPDVVMDYLPTIAHHHHHHRPLSVTVGGGDDFGGQV